MKKIENLLQIHFAMFVNINRSKMFVCFSKRKRHNKLFDLNKKCHIADKIF
jgi:hypothetical protein